MVEFLSLFLFAAVQKVIQVFLVQVLCSTSLLSCFHTPFVHLTLLNPLTSCRGPQLILHWSSWWLEAKVVITIHKKVWACLTKLNRLARCGLPFTLAHPPLEKLNNCRFYSDIKRRRDLNCMSRWCELDRDSITGRHIPWTLHWPGLGTERTAQHRGNQEHSRHT